MRRNSYPTIIVGLVACAAILTVPACQSMREAIGAAEESQAVAISERDRLAAIADDEARPIEERAQAANAATKADETAKAIGKVLEAAKAGQQPDGSFDVGASVATLGGIVPPPYGPMLLIAGPFIGLLGAWLRDRRAAQSIIDGIAKARAQSPELKAAMKAQSDTIGNTMTWHAYRMVEERDAK